jgi:2-keto-4-pentenoate hydratase/2-oxohepta-3-ene-1,7-dioic acid hydratase in catechol pathway
MAPAIGPEREIVRIIRFELQGAPRWGVVDPEGIVHAASGEPFVDLRPGEAVGPLDEVRLLAPATPRTIVCVGRNYVEHAAEFGNPVPEQPLLFLKPAAAVTAPGDPIVYPALSRRVDPEAELAVVIGRPAHRVAARDAFGVIGGYLCGNDVTARDIQKADGQWTRGKGFQTFCPLGPWVETSYDPSDVRVTCTVNGDRRQDGRTKDLIFDIPFLIEYITRFTRLDRGDVVMTGTPEGVGPVQVGDEITVEVEGLGALANPVVAEDGR